MRREHWRSWNAIFPHVNPKVEASSAKSAQRFFSGQLQLTGSLLKWSIPRVSPIDRVPLK